MMIERVVCYRPSFVGSLMVWDLLLSHRPMRRISRHGNALGREIRASVSTRRGSERDPSQYLSKREKKRRGRFCLYIDGWTYSTTRTNKKEKIKEISFIMKHHSKRKERDLLVRLRLCWISIR
jgi:hypothetical protein